MALPAEMACRKCKATLPVDSFQATPTGRRRVCRGCRDARDRDIIAGSPERRAKKLASNRAWTKAHPDESAAQRARSYDRNGAAQNARRVRDVVKLEEARKARVQTPTGRAATLCHMARARCRKSGLPFAVTADLIAARIAAGACEVSGIPFDLRVGHRRLSPWAPSIDRIDSSKGYTPENVQVVVSMLNLAKSDFSMAEVEQFVTAMAARRHAWLGC